MIEEMNRLQAFDPSEGLTLGLACEAGR